MVGCAPEIAEDKNAQSSRLAYGRLLRRYNPTLAAALLAQS